MGQNHSFIEESKAIGEKVIKLSSDLIVVLTKDGSVVFTSPVIKELLGYAEEEVASKSSLPVLHPEDLKIFASQKIDDMFHKTISFRVRRKQGDYIWLETTMQPLTLKRFNDADNEDLILCILRDITSRKIAENQFLDQIEIYRKLVEHSHDTIGIVTKEGIFTYINKTGKKLIGATTTSEIIGKTIYDFTHEREHPILQALISDEEKLEDSDFIESSLLRLDKDIRLIDVKVIPANFKNKADKQILIRDITEKKLTEERLKQAEKLSLSGHLAAGIAHEIRNPLTAIKGFAQLLKEEEEPNGYFDVMISELNRIDTIVDDLLILAKPQIKELKIVNINRLIRNLISLLSAQAIISNIGLSVHFNEEDIQLECDEDKLKQVFINIIKNALEAIKANGEVWVTVEKLPTEEVLISIKDNGCGIPKERLHRLGEPFYSTKEKGTGLGLMISRKIVEEHNGSLHISSEKNKGTVVTIRLPAYPYQKSPSRASH